jgi:hypothetical protein
MIEVSSSGATVQSHSGLGYPSYVSDTSTTIIVKPQDSSLHQQYDFHIKSSAYGGSTQFFGTYELLVGCFTASVTYTDNAAFTSTGVAKLVGDSVDSVYTFS